MTESEIRENRIKDILRGEISAIRVFEEIDSTSSEARRYAADGGAAPALFIADGQTAGRGRTGKSFYSPKSQGLYATLLLSSKAESAVYMTTAAAVAVRRAVLRVTGIPTDIKWVNDLYLRGKKAAGILCESAFFGGKGYVMIGFGINLSTEEFPADLTHTATSLGLCADLRDALAAACTEELLRVWQSGLTAELLEEYRHCSAVLGRPIIYSRNGISREGTATDIDNEGRLLVKRADGSEELLSSGEITVRLV